MLLCYVADALGTKVFLIRHGITDWHTGGKVLGRRDVGMNAAGRVQIEASRKMLADVPLSDLFTSPLSRAVEAAELIGADRDLRAARDPRLSDLDVGKWSGMFYDDITASREYQRFLAKPDSTSIPGGESLTEVRDRAVAAIEQGLGDSPAGGAVAVVTHAGVIRVLLSHYLGSPLANYHRIRVAPGSISVLSFSDPRELPRVLAVNCLSGLELIIAPRTTIG